MEGLRATKREVSCRFISFIGATGAQKQEHCRKCCRWKCHCMESRFHFEKCTKCIEQAIRRVTLTKDLVGQNRNGIEVDNISFSFDASTNYSVVPVGTQLQQCVSDLSEKSLYT